LLSRKSEYQNDVRAAVNPKTVQELMRRQHLGIIGEISKKQRKILGS
jgi:hypothetical protein